MATFEEADAAFTKIINHGPGVAFRKAAKVYWTAYKSDEGASEGDGKKFEESVSKIPIDYRTPALQCLDEFNACAEGSENLSECYFSLAIQLANKIVHVI